MTSDRKAGIILLLFCAFWAVATYRLPNSTLEGTPGPQFFPWLLVIALTVLSLLLVIKGGPKQTNAKADKEGNNEHEAKKPESLLKAFAIFLAILFYAIIVKYLGFMVGTIIGLFIIQQFNPERQWKISLLTSIGTGVVIVLVFKILLKIPLPSGILF